MVENRLTQTERLCGKKQIDELFVSGYSFITYPYRLVFSVTPDSKPMFSFFVSVPKRSFKRAVKRNRIRRRIKECYRLNKKELAPYLEQQGLHVNAAVLYLEKTELDYAQLDKKMKEMLLRLPQEIEKNKMTTQITE